MIYNGLAGYSGGQEISEDDEESVGAVTVVNFNDTDGDGRTDRDDEIVRKALTVTTAAAGQSATTITVDDTEGYEVDDNIAISKSDDSEGEVATVQSINTGTKVITLTAGLSRAYASGSKVYHAGRNEIDLMKLVLKKPNPDDGGNVTLTVVSGNIKLWESSTKGTEVGLTNGKVEYPTSQLDKTLWVEARSVSSSLRDIVLEMEYQGCKDTVKATGVWVTRTRVWLTRDDEHDGLPDNPKVGVNGQVTDLQKIVLVNRVNNEWQSAQGSRYGPGPCYRDETGRDSKVRGRILHEFEVSPPDSQDLKVSDLVNFDIARQVEARTYIIDNGSGTPDPEVNETFPWLQSPVLHNELPNDDISQNDEQNVAINRHLYVFDTPGTGAKAEDLQGNPLAFHIWRGTFKEWVRGQVKGAEFPTGAGQQAVLGSRASHKYNWHVLLYLVRGADGYFYPDVVNPSFSIPIASGTGNGQVVSITLLANADTEGFTATYDEPNKTWTLDGTSSDPESDQQDPAPEGTQWTLTIPNRITVVIEQGSPAFVTGDSLVFSVFKSTSSGGKKVELAEGYIDVTDGP